MKDRQDAVDRAARSGLLGNVRDALETEQIGTAVLGASENSVNVTAWNSSWRTIAYLSVSASRGRMGVAHGLLPATLNGCRLTWLADYENIRKHTKPQLTVRRFRHPKGLCYTPNSTVGV